MTLDMENNLLRNSFKKVAAFVASASPIALAVMILPAPALAQTDAQATNVGVEEITVTARRREERLQDTPISITALTARELSSRSLTALNDVAGFVPNVSMNVGSSGSGGGANLSVYIRGVGQNDFLFTVDPAVGVYVDGIYYPRSLGGVMDLLDVERIEVLRGPQGTLFGKNTVGGAINITSAKPTGETRGQVEVTTGRYNRIDVRGSFETSLIKDVLAAKVSASSKHRDGYAKRVDFFTGKTIDHPGDENQDAVRLALRWTPSESVTVDLTGDYSRWRQQSVPERMISFDESQSIVAQLYNGLGAGPLPISGAFISPDPYVSYGTGPNRNTLDAYGFGGTINWDVSDTISVKSITGYRNTKAIFGRDGDGSPLTYYHTEDRQRQHSLSQEVQLLGATADKRFKWVLGGYYFNEYGRDLNDVRLGSGLYTALQGLPGPVDGSPLSAPTAPGGFGNPINTELDLDLDVYNRIRVKSYAAFGQATYAITDALNFTAGIRYSKDSKRFTLRDLRIVSGATLVPLTTIPKSWDAFTPMASVDYRLSPELLVYASYSRGFKSGGYNGRPTVTGQIPVPFNPEKVTAYEVGFKSDLLDRKLRLNGSAYFNDYTDVQLNRVRANEFGVLIPDLGNAGDAHIKGFELELQAQPTPYLSISGGIGYTDFKYVSLAPGVTDISLNTRQPLVPKWSGNATIAYTIPLSDVSHIVARGDLSYRSKTFMDSTNLAALAQDAYALVNARISYENLPNEWELAVFVTNLTDKAYLAGGFSSMSSFGFSEGFYGRPREWGVSLRKRF